MGERMDLNYQMERQALTGKPAESEGPVELPVYHGVSQSDVRDSKVNVVPASSGPVKPAVLVGVGQEQYLTRKVLGYSSRALDSMHEDLEGEVAALEGANFPITSGLKVVKALRKGGAQYLELCTLHGEGPFSENRDHAMYELFAGVNHLTGNPNSELSRFRFEIADLLTAIKKEERKRLYGRD